MGSSNYDFSWYNSYTFVFMIQKRIFKSAYVSDFKSMLFLQNLLLSSNSARLLSIRDVTQISSIKKISGVDNKITLTFSERFKLNEYIKLNYKVWFPSASKKLYLFDKDGEVQLCRIPTIVDRAWLELVKKSLEPAHEAIFSPRNFGFRLSRSLYQTQNNIFSNINTSSYGWQKRFLKICLPQHFFSFDVSLILEKILLPRSIKLGILRSFKSGLFLSFCATCYILCMM